MASENVVMNLTANADFSNLVTSVNRVSASLLKMQEQIGASNRILTGQIAATNKAFSDTLRQTGQFGTHFVTLTDDVAKFGNNLDKGQLKLRDYYGAWQQHAKTSGGLIRQLAQQQVQLQNAILQPLGKNAQGLMQFNVQVPKGLDAVKNRTALATQELKIMNKVVQEGANQMINWGKNTQWAGRQLTVGLTVPIAAFGMAASKAFREADQELVRLTKVYGGVAATSTAELQKIRKEISATAAALSKEYGASYKETIGLAADLAATGKQGNDLLKATAETTRLMILGEVDRQDAMKATLTIQNTFKQNTKELAESINFLNAVENQTSLTIQDLTEAIPKAGPVVKALGGDVKDLALYLTAMKEGGIGASEGANAIKSAFASMINPTKVATEQFKSFGIDLQGMVKKNTGDTTQMLLDLQGALDKLDPLSKSKAIEQLFGKFQFARMTALIDNLGKQGSQSMQVLDLLKQSTSDIASIADRELKQVTESASGKYRRAVEGLKADLAGIGDEFLKIQTFFINVTDKIVKFVNMLPAPIKSILTFLTGLTAVAGPLIMLTGVMANFIGYVIKGAFHFKSLFKSGEGWRMLTPEILAAQKAGSLIEKTFYSDAKAALSLAEALQVLEGGYARLQAKMNAGVVPVNPVISNLAGSIMIPGAGAIPRVVDPTNPLVGQQGTRASAHINPLRGRTQQQIDSSTIFGFVPGPIPVNNALKDTPQIYTNSDLPNIPGLTTSSSKHGPVSTGIVAAEATKWQTLMGTMSMMSKTEVAAMKKQIQATGTVSDEFMTAYSSLLPQITNISEEAVMKSAAIVSQVKSGEMGIAQARERLIQLNYEIEAAMGAATTGVATSLGRTANLTAVPGIDQPVVDPKGKSNMRQLFGKGNSAWVDRLAGVFGVKTWGASYSTHTTRPKRLNEGGRVYDPSRDGNIVPGDTSINYDNTPARLQAGGFILNQTASRNNPDLVSLAQNARNSGGPIVSALLTPGETYFPPSIAEQIMPTLEEANNGGRPKMYALGGLVSPTKTNYGLNPGSLAAVDKIFSKGGNALRKWFWDTSTGSNAAGQRDSLIRSIQKRPLKNPATGRNWTEAELRAASEKEIASIWKPFHRGHVAEHIPIAGSDNYFSPGILMPMLRGANISAIKSGNPKRIAQQFESQAIHPTVFLEEAAHSLGYSNVSHIDDAYNAMIKALNDRNADFDPSMGDTFEKFVFHALSPHLKKVGNGRGNLLDDLLRMGTLRGVQKNRTRNANGTYSSGKGSIQATAIIDDYFENQMRLGGKVGGRVRSGKYNYGIKNPWRNWAKDGVAPHLEAAFSKKFESYPNGQMPTKYDPAKPAGKYPMPRSYYQDILNSDPLHGPLQIGRYQAPMHIRSQMQGARIRYTGSGYHKSDLAPAFVTGDLESRAKTALFNYMQGDYAAIDDPAVQSYLSTLRTKFTGTLHRGVRNPGSLPPIISNLIQAGKWDELIGKEFIMRRSSWSTNKDTAEGFGALQLIASVKNRNAVPASQIFPDLTFQSAKGPVAVNESEVYMGGKFKIVGAEKGKLRLQAIYDAAREDGGPVNSGRPYLVGEKGPELFVPRNSGGIIPNYALGGVVRSGKTGYGNSPKAVIGKNVAGMLAWMLGPTLLEKMGVSPKITNGLMTAGVVGQGIYGVRSSLKAAKAAQGVDEVAEGAVKAEGALAKLGPRFVQLGGYASKAAGPIGLVVTGLQIYQMLENNRKKNQEIYSVSFGLTAKTAKEAGIQIKKLDDQLKASSDEAKSGAAKAALLTASDSAGIAGLNLTVKQLKDLETSVKKTMPTYMDAFKKMTGNEIVTGAARIKAQWVAMGMSVSEANAKIYTLIKLTHGESSALTALQSQSFKDITDKASAAKEAVQLVGLAIKNINNTGAAGAAAALETFFQIQKSRLQDLKNQAVKDNNVNPNSSAYNSLMGTYSNSSYKNVKITRDMIGELSKTEPVLASILNATDTIGSSLSKWIIATSGSIENLDKIGNLTAAQANKVAKAITIIQDASDKAISANSSDPLIAAAEKRIANLKASFDKASKASAGMSVVDQIATKKRIKSLEDEIKKINEAAAARKKALQEQLAGDDAVNQIKKKQLDYQQALAAGDSAAAAQAQLDIQQLAGTRQTQMAMNAIDINAANQIKPLQETLDKLNAILSNNQDNVALGQDSASKIANSLNDLTTKERTLETALAKILQDKMGGASSSQIAEDKKILLAAYADLVGIKKKDGVYTDPTTGKALTADGVYEALSKAANKEISVNGQTVIVNASQLLNGKDLYTDKPLGNLSVKKANAVKENEKKPLEQQNPNVPYSPPKNPNDKTGESGISGYHNPLIDKAKMKPNKEGFYNIAGPGVYMAPKKLVGKSGDYYYEVNGNVTLAEDRTQFVGRWLTYTGAGMIGYAGGGSVKHYEQGSPGGVKGPGTSTSDSIPSYLSVGEHVIKASSVDYYKQKFGPTFFDDLNAQRFAAGGEVTNYSKNFQGEVKPTYQGGKLMGPAAAWQEAHKEIIKIKVPPIRSNFSTNSYDLNKKQRLELQSIAQELIKQKIKSIVVQGHADSRGGVDNDLLSLNRAKATAEYLSKFVEGVEFIPVGHGVYKPLVPNTSAENMAQNRRAELFLPDQYKTVYPEYTPEKHIGMIYGGGKLTSNIGSISAGKMSSSIDFGKLFDAVKSKFGFAQGGYIPKFENGINSVPVNMLAELHKNEAVIPANMNPFNPNANNATLGGTVYNVANVTMQFAEAPANGKALFADFKEAIRIENSKVGGTKEFGSRVMNA